MINHKSQTGEKIGKPTYIEVDKTICLIDLRLTVLEAIKDDIFEW